MKVIFTIANMVGGGSERVISILSNQFVKRGIDVSILMTAGNTIEYTLDSKVETVSMGGTSGGSMLKRVERIKNIRNYFEKPENKDAVLIAFGPGTSFYTWLSDIGLKHRLIISERNDPGACPHPILRNFIYKQAEKIVFQTFQAKDCFPKGISKKGVVIPNPIRPDIPDKYTGERRKTVVAVGRLDEQKNYPLLLKAFKDFLKKYPEYELHIFGKGHLENNLKAIAIEELGLGDKVVFEGFCKDVNNRIKDAGMFVLSSDYEGISNALIEAMALGLPVISTDCPIGGSSMCIENGKNGLLVPVGGENSLCEAMCKLAQDSELADELGENASKIRDRFNEETISSKWEALL